MISLNDSDRKVSILNDRSQGGSSLKPGSIELMIHRRLTFFDGRGPDDPLNETDSVNKDGITLSCKHYVIFERVDEKKGENRNLQYVLDTFPLVFLSKLESNATNLEEKNNFIRNCNISDNVRLWVKDYDNERFLLRLMNNDENNDKNVSIKFELEEMGLNGIEKREKNQEQRLNWGGIDFKKPMNTNENSNIIGFS